MTHSTASVLEVVLVLVRVLALVLVLIFVLVLGLVALVARRQHPIAWREALSC